MGKEEMINTCGFIIICNEVQYSPISCKCLRNTKLDRKDCEHVKEIIRIIRFIMDKILLDERDYKLCEISSIRYLCRHCNIDKSTAMGMEQHLRDIHDIIVKVKVVK